MFLYFYSLCSRPILRILPRSRSRTWSASPSFCSLVHTGRPTRFCEGSINLFSRIKHKLHTSIIWPFFKPGGLNLSRHGLDRDSRSRHFYKSFSTALKSRSRRTLCSKISIFVKISIETLNLDTYKSRSQLSRKSRQVSKSWSRQIETSRSRLLSTVETPRLTFFALCFPKILLFAIIRIFLCFWPLLPIFSRFFFCNFKTVFLTVLFSLPIWNQLLLHFYSAYNLEKTYLVLLQIFRFYCMVS